jgi:hypothetical protein
MSTDVKSYEDAAKQREFADYIALNDLDVLFRRYGADMAQNTVEVLISRITDDPWRQEALRLRFGRLKVELAGECPSPIERALAENVAVCYFDRYLSNMLAQTNSCPELERLVQQKQDKAMRRYTHAIEMLAVYRKVEAETIDRTVKKFKVVG